MLKAERNRSRHVYLKAKNALSDFDQKALSWADVSNKINKTSEEKELISEVSFQKTKKIQIYDFLNFSFKD